MNAKKMKIECSPPARDGVRRIVLREDLSVGRSRYRVPVINAVDQERLCKKFVYSDKCKYDRSTVVVNLDDNGQVMSGCKCKPGECRKGTCACIDKSTVDLHKDGRVRNAQLLTGTAFASNILFECSPETCSCEGSCSQRLTPLDGKMAHKLEIYKDRVRGFCCRTQEDYPIRRGRYVCNFVGEILPNEEHHLRDQAIIGEYSMNVPTSNEDETVTIDPYYYGNCSRFFAHSCNSNTFYVQLFSEHRDMDRPTVAIVAGRNIYARQDLTINYGDDWWSARNFGCACGSVLCRFAVPYQKMKAPTKNHGRVEKKKKATKPMARRPPVVLASPSSNSSSASYRATSRQTSSKSVRKRDSGRVVM